MTDAISAERALSSAKWYSDWLAPHRIMLALTPIVLAVAIVTTLRWEWLPQYQGRLIYGVAITLALLVSSCAAGFLIAILLGLTQVVGPKPLGFAARVFCDVIRGTPLLLQIWLLYYGVGSILANNPDFRHGHPEFFYYLRQAWLYAFCSLTVSFAAYEGEVMRGAFIGVPRGELEAARAFGMTPLTMFRRIWLPRAIHRALPTLSGDVIGQLKATPLVATITVTDIYGVIVKVRQDTFLTYEPLFFLTFIYLVLTGALVLIFRYFEKQIPVRT
ncbi:MAG: ABC transporter permease subunit [Mesorhizobium sp.]|nr:MAG: ABC transporter permease subunit [Mesorhizobium sp.]